MNNWNRPKNSPIKGALLAMNMAPKLISKLLKRWNWHGERPREKQMRDIHGGKGEAVLSWMDRRNQRRDVVIMSVMTTLYYLYFGGN